jgi:UTP--glucose-1-phosphate uridylyltransferase
MRVRKAVIPVAGFGTRFLPATKATPKEMFPLVDKPLAQHVVEEAAASGIEEIIFVTGQAKRAIEDHFDRNFELEFLLEKKGKTDQLKTVREISDMVQFAYVRQKEMKGLGHAVLQAKNLVQDEPFAVITPDDVFSGNGSAVGDVIAAYEATQAPVVGVQRVPKDRVHLYGIVEGQAEGKHTRVSRIVEKPTSTKADLAICGRYILFPEIFDIMEGLPPGQNGEIQLADAINELARMRPTFATEIKGQYHDAGSKLGYMQAFVEFGLARDDLGADFKKFLKQRLK